MTGEGFPTIEGGDWTVDVWSFAEEAATRHGMNVAESVEALSDEAHWQHIEPEDAALAELEGRLRGGW